MGVRSMACMVEAEAEGMKVVIDPGTALGPRRFRLRPHPVEQEAAQRVQKLLQHELADATHVVITHFHGDHHPMVEADTSQLKAGEVLPLLRKVELLAKSSRGVSRRQKYRRRLLEQLLGKAITEADGACFGALTFSDPVPHGERDSKSGAVTMLKLSAGSTTFVHGSDIQLLDDRAVEIICQWKPDIVFIAGPPLYIFGNREEVLTAASRRLSLLASACGTVILDHHIMRSREGEAWVDGLSQIHGNICCAADFVKQPRTLLEADRKILYTRSLSENSKNHRDSG
jgi:predicted metallo-beta-lactamase superfamily hydrolase